MKTITSFSAAPLTALRDFDWERIKRLTDPQAIKDLDHFLDNLPQRAGKNALMIACGVWLLAGIGLFLLFHNAQSLKDIQKQLAIAEGTRIAVPHISYRPADAQILKPVVEKLKKIYPSLIIAMQDSHTISIKATTTRDFAAWRAAIGDVSYASQGWKLGIKTLCTGRSCKGEPLQAAILVQNVDIQLPDMSQDDNR